LTTENKNQSLERRSWLTVVLVSDDVGENDVLDLGGVDAELLVDFDEEVEGERLVVEGRSSSAHERSWQRSDVLLGSGEEILLAVGDVVAEGSLNLPLTDMIWY
jgi:hypothetical protein